MTSVSSSLNSDADTFGNPLFSIIIPVYNTSAYIQSCLQSLITQDEPNFEIIAVDDGSTDDSYQILNRIAESETRLKVFSKANGGQGMARNLGLTKASGRYIMFVDSDDTVAPNLLSVVFDHLSDTEIDVVSFGVDFHDENDRVVARRVPINNFSSTGKDIYLDAMLDRNFLSVVWNKVYKHSLLKDNSITFPELRAYEDSVFSRHVALSAQKVQYINKSLYFALVRSGSTSRGMTKSSFLHAAEMIETERELFNINAADLALTRIFRAHIARFLAYIIIQAAFRIDDPGERSACLEIADEIGFTDCATDRSALALLDIRMKLQVLLARNPTLLRVIAKVARRFNFAPY